MNKKTSPILQSDFFWLLRQQPKYPENLCFNIVYSPRGVISITGLKVGPKKLPLPPSGIPFRGPEKDGCTMRVLRHGSEECKPYFMGRCNDALKVYLDWQEKFAKVPESIAWRNGQLKFNFKGKR